MTTTGKRARKRYGTRVAAKRAKARKPRHKRFGTLPISVSKGNAAAFVLANSGELELPPA